MIRKRVLALASTQGERTMIDDIKPNKTWHIGPEEAEQATIEKCAHLHASYRTREEEGIDGEKLTFGWWECDAGCGTRFIPIEVRDMSFIEYFQNNEGITRTEEKP